MQDPIKAGTRAAEFQYNNVTAPCRKRTFSLVSLRARTSQQLILKRDLSAADPVAAIDESSRHDDSFKSRTSSRVGELARCTRGHCVRSRIDPHFSSARGLCNKSAYACANATSITIAKSRVSYAWLRANTMKAVLIRMKASYFVDQIVMIIIINNQKLLT